MVITLLLTLTSSNNVICHRQLLSFPCCHLCLSKDIYIRNDATICIWLVGDIESACNIWLWCQVVDCYVVAIKCKETSTLRRTKMPSMQDASLFRWSTSLIKENLLMIIIEPMSICKECYSPSLMHQSTNSLESSPHKTISAQVVVLLNTMGESFVLCVYILYLQWALIYLDIKMSFIKV